MNARVTAICMLAQSILLACAALIHSHVNDVDGAAEVAGIEGTLAVLLATGAFAPLVGRAAAPIVLALQMLALIALCLGFYLSLIGIGPRSTGDAALRLISIAVVSYGIMRTQRGTAATD